MQARGGVLTVEDLAAYKPLWREPLVGSFRGHQVWAAPAPAGGLTEIETLQILDARPPLTALGRGSSAADHVIAEALKHAFADRARSLGDPAFVKVLEDKLTSPAYARTARRPHQRRQGAQPARRTATRSWPGPADAPHDHGTSHLCVADGEGNVVALTTTVNLLVRLARRRPHSGVVLNDEMDDFSAQPGAPNAFGLIGAFANAVAPGKRPLSSMTPTIVTRDGVPILCVGAAGGPTIVSSTVQTIVNVRRLRARRLGGGVGAAHPRAVDAERASSSSPTSRATSSQAWRSAATRSCRCRRWRRCRRSACRPTRLTAASDPRYGGAPAAP